MKILEEEEQWIFVVYTEGQGAEKTTWQAPILCVRAIEKRQNTWFTFSLNRPTYAQPKKYAPSTFYTNFAYQW